MHGLWTGEPTDLASLAGTAVGDLLVFGDIRDATREGTRYLTGQKYDPWILSLAGVGIGITAGTYATLGAGTPERVGLSVVKAAKRTGRLNPALAVRAVREAVKVEGAGGLIELAENTGRIESKAGAQAALDGLAVAEEPTDVSRLARLSAAKGGKTRAIVKLFGRGAIILAASALDLTLWMFWAALALFGFCSSCKAAVERPDAAPFAAAQTAPCARRAHYPTGHAGGAVALSERACFVAADWRPRHAEFYP